MSSILDRDTDLQFPNVTVVAASAGSGKTHALTVRLVQLLLSARIKQNALPNILAITFTNNAAQEMRQRVLMLLKSIALGEPSALGMMGELVEMENEAMQANARMLVTRIFEQYSDFQVMTIDSFMSAVFRSSALELGFPPDVEILLESDALIDEAFATISREMNENPNTVRALEKVAGLLATMRDESTSYLWDPYSHIAAEIKKLYKLLGSRSGSPRPVDLTSHQSHLKQDIVTSARSMRVLLEESKLRVNRFLLQDLIDASAGDVDRVAGKKLKRDPVSRPRTASEQVAFVRWGGEIAALHAQWNDLISEYTLCNARMYFQPYLTAVGVVTSALLRVKKGRGKVALEDVNKILDDHLRAENVPDIYVHLGNRICHYLIDEFQDTSPIQWSNLQPLVGNSLAEPWGSLFIVGDTRQSIYSFRGADWRIMARMSRENVFPSAHRTIRSLDTNWRSYENIVRFNREVFEKIIPSTDYAGAAERSGLTHVDQFVRPEYRGKGYVEVSLLDQEKEVDPERARLLEVIHDCTRRGYAWNDIAILTPNNDDVIRLSGWLNDAEIEFLSYSSLDIRTRPLTGELLSLFRFLDAPVDDLSFATFVLGDLFTRALHMHGSDVDRETLRRFIFREKRDRVTRPPLYKSFQAKFPELWRHFFADLYGLVGYLPLYDFVAEAYKVFDVFAVAREDEATLVKLLEVVKEFEERSQNSIKDFLEFALDEAEKSGWEMDVPKTKNAVTVMTIHKAKGLDFPVVIVLLYDSRRRGPSYYVAEDNDGIHLLRITAKSADKVPWLQNVFEEQAVQNQVDELNTLYVALTRAKEEMYVLGVFKGEPKYPTSFLPKGYDPAVKPVVPHRPPVEMPTMHIAHHNLRTPIVGRSFEKIGLAETRRGDFLHAVLSRIENVGDDVAGDIKRAMGEISLPPVDDPARAVGTISAFLTVPEIRAYFLPGEGRKVLREQEFANRLGGLFRMDRVVMDKNLVTVIDFKTGGDEKEDEYRNQLVNYVNLLRDVFSSVPVRGIVAYVDRKKVTLLA